MEENKQHKTALPETEPIPSAQAPEALLDIRGLRVEYHTDEDVVYAVNGLDLTIGKGESLGLVGETGAGKTTTALSVLRLIADPPGKIMGGEIWFEGEDMLQAKPARLREIRGSKISVIFQDPMTSLNPVYSVGDQIAEVIHQHEKCSKEEGRRKAGDMLEMVGMPRARYDEYPHQFSGGMTQRVVIAMSNPALGLELMNELKEKHRTTLLLITHDLGVGAQVCDRVAIMYAGEIVESGTIAEVFDHPHHPYTIGLFGSIPSLDETAEKLKPIQGQMPDPTELPEGCAFAPRCPYATGACRTRKPEMTGVGGTQMVRCLAHQGVFESPELMEEVRHGR